MAPKPGTGIWLKHIDRHGTAYTHYFDRHRTLVEDALQSWVGETSTMRIHMDNVLNGRKSMPGAHMSHARAKALLREVKFNGVPNPKMLYRGQKNDSLDDNIPSTWSEKAYIGKQFAKRYGGEVAKAPKGTVKGIRMGDYIQSGLNDREQQWLVVRRQP